MRLAPRLLLLSTAALCGRGFAPASPAQIAPAELAQPPSEMRAVIERFSVDRATLLRANGGELSPARQSRLTKFYAEWLAAIARFDFDRFDAADRVDYLLLKSHLEYEARQLEIQERMLAETAGLVPFARAILDLEDGRRRMEPVDSPKVAAALDALSKQIEGAQRQIEAELKTPARPEAERTVGHRKKSVANRAAGTLDALRASLRAWFGFYNGYDPLFTWWIDNPYRRVDQALERYAAFLREKVLGLRPESGDAAAAPPPGTGRGAGPAEGAALRGGRGGAVARTQAQPGSSADVIGDPIGRDALLVELQHEMIPYTPEELITLAEKELRWCEAEMKKAARDLGYGEDWMKALEHVKKLYVEPGKQPAMIRELALEAIRFMDEHDLVTIPDLARESWRMEMMTPERQLVNPFFLGGETIQVSYPTSGMSHEQKMMSMRGNNIHFARATVFHELIPGHHLQGFMTARHRTYRAAFSTPFWGEGWALYWELLLWDMGFARTPENRIGMLFWRSHRCARIMFSLGFHLGKMTPQECIDLLVKRVGHEPENATAEVRRSFAGAYSPLYQAAYLLGGLQIFALHKELVGSGKMTNRAFHDAVLKENRIPVEMVRALLTGQKLARDHRPSWRFYGAF
jgi:uncharacterized protein (DUF885 family)